MLTREFKHPMTNKRVAEELIKKWRKFGTLYIGVDFDNTVCPYEEAKNGNYEDILDLLREAKKVGLKLCLWSVSDNEVSLQSKIQWCKDQEIEMDYINESPLVQHWGNKKQHFNLLLDDVSGLESSYVILYDVIEFINQSNSKKQ